jgi:hypothetical protein
MSPELEFLKSQLLLLFTKLSPDETAGSGMGGKHLTSPLLALALMYKQEPVAVGVKA